MSGYFLAPYPEAATDEDVYHTKNLILGLFLLLILPVIIPATVISSVLSLLPFYDYSWNEWIFLLSSLLLGAALGFLMDLNKRTRESGTGSTQKERGVFIRITSGDRQIVISERMINCFIIAEIVLVVLMFGVMSSGVLDRIVVEGKYVGYDYENGSSIGFNTEMNTFTQKKYGISKSGTYLINGTVLTLYYSDGNTTRYSIHDLGIRLFPMDRSQFVNGREWGEEEYLKPVFM